MSQNESEDVSFMRRLNAISRKKKLVIAGLIAVVLILIILIGVLSSRQAPTTHSPTTVTEPSSPTTVTEPDTTETPVAIPIVSSSNHKNLVRLTISVLSSDTTHAIPVAAADRWHSLDVETQKRKKKIEGFIFNLVADDLSVQMFIKRRKRILKVTHMVVSFKSQNEIQECHTKGRPSWINAVNEAWHYKCETPIAMECEESKYSLKVEVIEYEANQLHKLHNFATEAKIC